MVTFRQYRMISRSYTLHTITKPYISLLFGIIGGVVVVVVAAGITITEALHVHHAAANSPSRCSVDLQYCPNFRTSELKSLDCIIH